MTRKLLPAALVAIPTLYYVALLVGAATYPGYSHATNYASELGAAGAPYPQLFNVSAMLCGLAAMVASALLPAAIDRVGGARPWAVAAAIAMALFGISMVMAGMFPIPDERHGAFGLGLAGLLIPLLVYLAIRRVPGSRTMQLFLLAVFVLTVVMMAIMFGVGQLVTRANVGIWQRLNSLVTFPWFAVLGVWLARRLPRTGA